MTPAKPLTPVALQISAGVIVWAVHFGIVYGYTGLACARRFEPSGATWIALVPWVIGVATLLGALLTLALIVPVLRAPRRIDFSRWMGACLAALALVAILLEGVAVIWVPVCG
jgi:hypothetical protein